MKGTVVGIVDATYYIKLFRQSARGIVYHAREQPYRYISSGTSVEHALRHLAHKGLFVGFALARDDKVGIMNESVEVGKFEHYVYARMKLCIKIDKEGVTQSACCACSGTKSQLGSGIASLFGLPGKGTQLTVERRYLLGGGALLRSKDIGCAILAIQRIVNVASYYYPAFHVKASFGSHGFYHAASAIACGTSAYAHHYRLAASLHGICHHLNHT